MTKPPKIMLPNVRESDKQFIVEAGSSTIHGSEFFPILWFSPETGRFVVSFPLELPIGLFQSVIDAGIACLLQAREDCSNLPKDRTQTEK